MSEIPNNNSWLTKPLSKLVDILDNKRIPINRNEREKRIGNIPYYGATGQVGWIDDFIFNEELVLLGEDGAPFLDPAKPKAYMIHGKSWVNNHAHVLRAKPGLLNSFLLYQLNTIDYKNYISGTTRAKLPQGPLKCILLLLPSENEQRRIVAEIEKQFTRLEAGVAALQRAKAHLKRYRASVLKAACEGRLVPAEAELARREGRDYETGAQLLARVLKERRFAHERTQNSAQRKKKYEAPAALNISELPELSEGWAWASMGQLGLIIGGLIKNPKRMLLSKKLPYLRVANVYHNELRLEEIEYIGIDEKEIDKSLLQKGDLLIVEGNGSRDQIGRIAIWNGSIESCVHQNHIIKARLIEKQVPQWILFWLQSYIGRQYVEAVASSTSGLYTLSISKVESLPVPLPPLVEQRRIVAEVERLLSVADTAEAAVEANLKRAQRLRQAILRRAFSGEL